MKSSYDEKDVEILLKDITGMVEPQPAEVREKKIQSGTHYCEMIPLEYQPSEKYMKAYEYALSQYAKDTADAIARMSEKIYEKKRNNVVIVSLARAGLPIGILSKRYLEKRHNIHIKHYSISIIRGRGIDRNAMKYILAHNDASSIQFLDGWVGKGAIFRELESELSEFQEVSRDLAVVSDPANITDLCGTHDDILIPSSCLNAVVTGLISRTFLRGDIIGENDFHGAVYYKELEKDDLSNIFLNEIEKNFDYSIESETIKGSLSGIDVVKRIAEDYEIGDINFVKPGIGETTRALLRRIPWKVLINPNYSDTKDIAHILQLAKEKKVPVETCASDMGNYKVCGLIKKLADI